MVCSHQIYCEEDSPTNNLLCKVGNVPKGLLVGDGPSVQCTIVQGLQPSCFLRTRWTAEAQGLSKRWGVPFRSISSNSDFEIRWRSGVSRRGREVTGCLSRCGAKTLTVWSRRMSYMLTPNPHHHRPFLQLSPIAPGGEYAFRITWWCSELSGCGGHWLAQPASRNILTSERQNLINNDTVVASASENSKVNTVWRRQTSSKHAALYKNCT